METNGKPKTKCQYDEPVSSLVIKPRINAKIQQEKMPIVINNC